MYEHGGTKKAFQLARFRLYVRTTGTQNATQGEKQRFPNGLILLKKESFHETRGHAIDVPGTSFCAAFGRCPVPVSVRCSAIGASVGVKKGSFRPGAAGRPTGSVTPNGVFLSSVQFMDSS